MGASEFKRAYRQILAGLASTLVLWLSVPCWGLTPQTSDAVTARLTEAHGRIFKRGFVDWEKELWGDPEKASIGDLLHEGMQLGTGAKSWAQISWPSVTTRAWENTVFAIAPNKKLVYLIGGEMLFSLDKKRKQKGDYYVWTKVLQARVRGTTVVVQATDEASRISVLEGCIDVLNRIDHNVIRIVPGVVYEIRHSSGEVKRITPDMSAGHPKGDKHGRANQRIHQNAMSFGRHNRDWRSLLRLHNRFPWDGFLRRLQEQQRQGGSSGGDNDDQSGGGNFGQSGGRSLLPPGGDRSPGGFISNLRGFGLGQGEGIIDIGDCPSLLDIAWGDRPRVRGSLFNHADDPDESNPFSIVRGGPTLPSFGDRLEELDLPLQSRAEEALSGNRGNQRSESDGGPLNIAYALPSTDQPDRMVINVFESKECATNLCAASAQALRDHPLVQSFDRPLPSISLIENALAKLPDARAVATGGKPPEVTATNLLSCVISAAEVLRVPTAMSYKVGAVVGRELSLPPASIAHWPPSGLIGQTLPLVERGAALEASTANQGRARDLTGDRSTDAASNSAAGDRSPMGTGDRYIQPRPEQGDLALSGSKQPGSLRPGQAEMAGRASWIQSHDLPPGALVNEQRFTEIKGRLAEQFINSNILPGAGPGQQAVTQQGQMAGSVVQSMPQQHLRGMAPQPPHIQQQPTFRPHHQPLIYRQPMYQQPMQPPPMPPIQGSFSNSN